MKIRTGVSPWADFFFVFLFFFFAIEQVADGFLKRLSDRTRRRPGWVHSAASS